MEILNKGIISLLIPCYNGGSDISRCLDSVIAQTVLDKVEVIIVNDGSTDNSEEEILKYEDILRDKAFDFKYIVQKNAGVGAATNTALQYFTGEFLTLLDIDDYLMEESLELRSNWLIQHPEYSTVLNSGYYVTDKDYFTGTKKFSTYVHFNEETVFNDIIDGKVLSWSGSYMFRSEVWLKRYPDRKIYPSRYGQNMQMLLPAIYHEKVGYIDKPLMRYLIQEQSLSHFSDDGCGEKKFKATYGYQDIYENVLNHICEENEKELLIDRIRKSSSHTRLGIALKYKNKQLSEVALQELINLGGCTLNDRIQYEYLNNKPLHYLLRCKRKIKHLLKMQEEV